MVERMRAAGSAFKSPLNKTKASLYAVLVIGALTTVAYFSLFLFTDISTVARIIVWREPDTGDLYRFPSRTLTNAGPAFSFPDASATSEAFRAPFAYVRDGVTITQEFGQFLEANDTVAFIAVHGGELVYERYFAGVTRDTIRPTFDVTLSVASVLVGIAIDEALIESVDDPVTKYVPELSDRDGRFDDITIRHLLSMSSGIDFFALGRVLWGDRKSTYYSTNLRELALTRKIDIAPGRVFEFNNFNAQLIGVVLERVTGGSVSAYLEEKLWTPLGMESPGTWTLDSDAHRFERMDVGLNATAIDLAKIGQLYLNDGAWAGKQIVSASWVADSTRQDQRTDPSRSYQYGWKLNVTNESVRKNQFYAEGQLGQFLWVAPDQDVLFVRFGESAGGSIWPREFPRLVQRFE